MKAVQIESLGINPVHASLIEHAFEHHGDNVGQFMVEVFSKGSSDRALEPIELAKIAAYGMFHEHLNARYKATGVRAGLDALHEDIAERRKRYKID
jgi:hypothetical protein